MKKILYFTVVALTVVACGRGPKHIDEIQNAKIEALEIQNQKRYQLVTDPASGLSGVADMTGKIFVPVKYKDIVPYFNTNKSEDLFMVATSEGLCGAYNASGKKIIKEEYDAMKVYPAASKVDTIPVIMVYKTKQRNNTYEIGPNGEKIVDDGSDVLCGALGADGKELVPCKFKHIEYCGKGFFEVTTTVDKNFETFKGLYKDGKEVIPCEYDILKVSGFANGAAAATNNQKTKSWCAFDLANGGAKTNLFYDGPQLSVSDNFIIFPLRNPTTRSFKAQVVDFSGNTVISADKYNKIREFNGSFICDAGGHDVILDKSQKEVFGEKSCRLKYESGVLIVDNQNRGRKGVITLSGKWIIPCEYSHIDIKPGKILAYPYGRGRVKEFPLP